MIKIYYYIFYKLYRIFAKTNNTPEYSGMTTLAILIWMNIQTLLIFIFPIDIIKTFKILWLITVGLMSFLIFINYWRVGRRDCSLFPL